MIRKIGNKYHLISKKGKTLSKHPSRDAAKQREKQVQFFKYMSKK